MKDRKIEMMKVREERNGVRKIRRGERGRNKKEKISKRRRGEGEKEGGRE